MPHVMGPAGAPPPPPPNEVKLLAEIARLSTLLDAALRSVEFARGTAHLFSGSPHGDAAAVVVAAYEKLTKETI